MARSRKTPFPAWQTCKPDGVEQRYIRLGNSQLMHPATLSLSDRAFCIYTYMLLESGGSRQFEFPRSKVKQLCGNKAFQKARAELIEKGFIREKQNNANLRKPNIYEFLEDWKQYIPP